MEDSSEEMSSVTLPPSGSLRSHVASLLTNLLEPASDFPLLIYNQFPIENMRLTPQRILKTVRRGACSLTYFVKDTMK